MEAGPRKQPDFNSQQCEMLQAPETAITNLPILRRRLLAWYATNRRDLPWRRSANPYRIWLSEIMLQQTRVAAVLEHYRAFLARFPTVEHLAAAPLSGVLAAWSGLGYYRRARALHRAARQIVERHGSRLPRTLPELRALPGVGTLYQRRPRQHRLRSAGRSRRRQCRARLLASVGRPEPCWRAILAARPARPLAGEPQAARLLGGR